VKVCFSEIVGSGLASDVSREWPVGFLRENQEQKLSSSNFAQHIKVCSVCIY
jgi:hypothetical protein